MSFRNTLIIYARHPCLGIANCTQVTFKLSRAAMLNTTLLCQDMPQSPYATQLVHVVGRLC